MGRGIKKVCKNGLMPPGACPHLLGKFDRVTGEAGAQLGVQMGSRSNLYHLLMPPLDGAVTLIQVQDVPILVP